MNQETAIIRSSRSRRRGMLGSQLARLQGLSTGELALWVGALALAIPTMIAIARFSWSTEQGGHGPIVFATGVWLLVRQWKHVKELRRPGSPLIASGLLMLFCAVYVLARVTGILEIEGFALYGALLTAVYAIWGWQFLRHLWFPIVYFGFVFPPPDSLVAAVTQPIKIAISEWAVTLLHALDYPIASSGVTIQIAQYELLVAAACAGMNSIISLTAICLFYIYIRHQANYRYAGLLLLAIIPAAVFANFARVLILILMTYHFGDAAAQGFIHNFAGITMFALSLAAIFSLDFLLTPVRERLQRNTSNG